MARGRSGVISKEYKGEENTAYGSVMQPLKEGQKAHYCQNGLWRSTGKIMRVLEQNDERVKFETDTVCYCINFYEEGTGVVALAA